MGHNGIEIRLQCEDDPGELPQEMVQLYPFVYIVTNLRKFVDPLFEEDFT
jgi:hypothetical protein